MEQLREKSQLIMITHQKRTMEIADALYGVTMRAGVTQVISQRLRDVQSTDIPSADPAGSATTAGSATAAA
jgi:chromosome segregation protein